MQIISQQTIASTGKKLLLAIPETEIDFAKYYRVRFDVLRKPWHQPKGSEKDAGDNTSHHVCLLNGDDVIGVCRLQINSADEAQIRYMAVSENYRRQKLGDVMLLYFENLAKQMEIKTIILQAREIAVGFYKHNGYEITEKTFLLFGEIQHYLMRKEV